LETPHRNLKSEIRNQKSEIGPEATTTTQQEIPAEILEGTPTNPHREEEEEEEPGSGFLISDFRFQGKG
jgi:hypothetical protein